MDFEFCQETLECLYTCAYKLTYVSQVLAIWMKSYVTEMCNASCALAKLTTPVLD